MKVDFEKLCSHDGSWGRTITRIIVADSTLHDGREIVVDSGGITQIIPYEEYGGLGPALWFAIYGENFEIVQRINAMNVAEVHYA